MNEIIFEGDSVLVIRRKEGIPLCYVYPGTQEQVVLLELAKHIQYLHERLQSEGSATVNQVAKDIEFKDRIFEIASECDCRADHGAEGAEHLKAIAGYLRDAIHAYEGRPE